MSRPVEVELFQRRLAREINARKQAEALLEQKSLELFQREQQENRRAEQALRASEERYQLLVEQSPEAILIEVDGRIVYANPAALRLFGAAEGADLHGCRLAALIVPGGHGATEREPERGAAFEERLRRLDGGLVEVAMTQRPFSYRQQPAVLVVMRDISERKQLEAQLNHLATHDPLTGLPNRLLLMDRLQQAILHAKRDHSQFVVAFIDLDRFKWINDSLGHAAGDRLLKTVAQRIAAGLRESDTIARFGGDEFVFIMQSAGSADEARLAIERVVAAVTMPLSVDGYEVNVTCSMGCSTYPDDGEEADALLRCADAAMYRAKQTGRNCVQVFDAELRAHIDQRVQLEIDLRGAAERGELTLHYQPQIDLHSGDIIAMEALLRWRHPTLGDIPPAEFIPIAEDCGFIEQLGEWVIGRVCQQAEMWRQLGLPQVRMAVNLSARQLGHPGLEPFIARCLAATGLDPACLELEFTESVPLTDPETIIPCLHRLKRLGVLLAIDDFGTGYSNLQYLKDFPVDCLKLDGSFVRGMGSDGRSLAVADAIVAMSHRLGLKVAAEMAETEGQVVLLAARGCDRVQGHYFSRAVPAEQCEALLRAGRMALPEKACARTIGLVSS